MTDRLKTSLGNARLNGRTLLCPFITAGYPDLAHLVPLLLALQEAGAGMVELGFPFSDPIADGPVIQESYRVALEKAPPLKKFWPKSAAPAPPVSGFHSWPW